MKSVTIQDIAQLVGVSTATVSRVLNGKGPVSTETKEKVLKVLKERNYDLSINERNNFGSQVKIVGVVSTNICIPHYSKVIEKLSNRLFQAGYFPILCNTGEKTEDKIKNIEMLIKLGCRTIFCLGFVFKDAFQKTSVLSDYNSVNYIINNCIISSNNAYSIINDEEYAIKLCIDHLIKKSHEHIAYVKDTTSFSGINKLSAFKNNLLIRHMNLDDSPVVETNRSLEGGKIAAQKLIESDVPFSAIIFGDDITVIGAMKYFQDKGMKIPQDIAIIGFNNSISSQCCTPALTTINANSDSIAESMLGTIKQLEQGNLPSHIIKVTPELIIREST